jgi:hypothetical protein
MPREQQHTAAVSMCLDDTLFTRELDPREHLIRPQRAELQQRREEPPEVRKHVARDRVALRVRPDRKRGTQILDRESPMPAVEEVERLPEQRAGPEYRAHRKQACRRDHAHDGQILDSMPERRAHRGGP